MIMYYSVPKIKCMTNVVFIFYFGLSFSPLPKKSKKMKKMPGDITILHICTKNYGHIKYSSWDMVHNGQMDRWKEWHIEVGAQPKELNINFLVFSLGFFNIFIKISRFRWKINEIISPMRLISNVKVMKNLTDLPRIEWFSLECFQMWGVKSPKTTMSKTSWL